MELTGIKDIDALRVEDRTVFVRVDFNVPMKDGVVTDPARIVGALPTINALRERGARVVLASHLGRPKGEPRPEFSLVPVAGKLAELLDADVIAPDDCVGDGVRKVVRDLEPGGVVLLENLRFHRAEEKADPLFARELASLADVYVNDAFGTAHRKHASTWEMVRHFADADKGCGYLIRRELQYLTPLLSGAERPYVGIMGGAKVSDKIKVIENLLGKLDILMIGGAMAYTFLKAQGVGIGTSLVEADRVELATRLIERAERTRTRLLLPLDHGIAPAFDSSDRRDTPDEEIPDGMMGLDIGPRTVRSWTEHVTGAKTVIWNGPVGLFEREPFHRGTFAIANAIADNRAAMTVIGGGDSAAAIAAAGRAADVTHVSTGGGASLEYLEGIDLPGIAALRKGCRFDP